IALRLLPPVGLQRPAQREEQQGRREEQAEILVEAPQAAVGRALHGGPGKRARRRRQAPRQEFTRSGAAAAGEAFRSARRRPVAPASRRLHIPRPAARPATAATRIPGRTPPPRRERDRRPFDSRSPPAAAYALLCRTPRLAADTLPNSDCFAPQMK